MRHTAKRVSCLYRSFGLFMLLFITMSFLYPPRICYAQITSFKYAYDRLMAEVFFNDPGETQIFGNPKQVDGTVYIKTALRQVTLGKGPGWVFYFVDDSRQTTIYNMVLISISGNVTSKMFKEKPLELGDYVLISDGTNSAIDRSDGSNSPLDLDGDGDNDTQFSATAANITAVFDILENNLDQDDILYIFTTNHGSSRDGCPWNNPDVRLTLWSESISDTDFATQVNQVTTMATVCIFEQCYSGGMLDDLYAPNRVLISAARFLTLSNIVLLFTCIFFASGRCFFS